MFYDRLVAEVQPEREAFLALPVIQAGMRGEFTKEAYIGYLSEAFHHVRHTVPLIEMVRSRLGPGRASLIEALSNFSLERKGYENWILQDIKNSGGDSDKVRDGEPSEATEELLAYMYDQVTRHDPIGIFGMLYIVEITGSKLASQTVKQFMATLGLPRKCFSYLLTHSSEDMDNPDYFKTLMAQITDPAEQDCILRVAKHVYGLYGRIFQSIGKSAGI
ncbi:MAG: iron-containing redox enzyme family protein [Kordiimonadaceae bacterium]|nr:iron-containing redox enzyme family protein [Kordiimonadaceae bacterium]MBO6568700.1 iron-containing redox enzyme family protein [Kordiimonadaceae bacterium]MBO6965324.1 iron-containing redox enzyme family protein [Kordiimonadaceae bacterium]